MRDRKVWNYIVRGIDLGVGPWFWHRLLEASTSLTFGKGPIWTRRRVAGRPIGAWALVATWLSFAVGLASYVLRR